ncbi:MAG TPA: LysR family transcriptional regulator [Planctomycetaceae bacterium]|nr:LysR family transcriptional regulator [Planctomycetaceae bacterium]
MPAPVPTIDQLRTLVQLADSGSVSAAADALGIRQPTAVGRLNVFRGRDSLLRTINNAVSLTERGEAVLPAVRTLVRQYDRVLDFLGGRVKTPRTFRVAVGASTAESFVPQALVLLRDELPDCDVQVLVARGAERIMGTADGRFDLAVVSHDRLQIASLLGRRFGRKAPLEIVDLPPQPMAVIAKSGQQPAVGRTGPQTPATRRAATREGGMAGEGAASTGLEAVLAGQEVPTSMLANWEIIGLDSRSGVRQQLERRLADRAGPLRYGPQAAGWASVKAYVRQGLGVGVVPLWTLSPDDCRDLIVRRLSRQIVLRHALVHRRSDDEPVAAVKQAFLRAAEAHSRECRQRWERVV